MDKLKTLHKNPYGADESDPSMRLVQVRRAGQVALCLNIILMERNVQI